MSEFKFSQDYIVYPPVEQGVYPISESEWNRIKRMLENVKTPSKVYSVLSSLFFGVCISAFFSYLALKTAMSIEPWLIPTTIAVLISSLILGFVFLQVDIKQRKSVEGSVSMVLDEIKYIEKNYQREQREQRKQMESEKMAIYL